METLDTLGVMEMSFTSTVSNKWRQLIMMLILINRGLTAYEAYTIISC